MKLDSADIDILTKKRFETIVETVVRTTELGYMDSIMHICESNELEVEDIIKYISPVIKNKLEAEAMNLNLIPRGSQLPL